LLPLRIDDLPEGLQESLAVGIFANEFVAVANRAVDEKEVGETVVEIQQEIRSSSATVRPS